MKPVDPDVSNILHADSNGRRRYLTERKNKSPRERYNDIQTVNSMYGWDQDSELVTVSSRHGRIHTISCITRTGPQPDPKHYTTPENSYAKCRWNKQ